MPAGFSARVHRLIAGVAAAYNAPRWCAILHLIAAAGTLMLLRGGSEAVADAGQRAAWLEAHPFQWRAGWLLWMAAAIALAGFYAWWGSRVEPRPAMMAMGITAAGLACDFTGEAIFIGWIPQPDTGLHRVAALLTGAAGNGFYTIAGILLTLVTPSMPRLVRGWAWLVWASGLSLTLMTVAGHRSGVVIASAALMALFIPWVVVAGVKLR